jgi:hypothetical protein
MERNAHRLTLHSPAREILPRMGRRFIDFAQTFPGFRAMDGNENDYLQPFTTMQPPCNTANEND